MAAVVYNPQGMVYGNPALIQGAPIAYAIAQWALNQGVRIADAYAVGGQFEIWAQVEIAILIRQFCAFYNLPLDTVKREHPVFTEPALHADFAMLQPAHLTHVVEFKIEGSGANAVDKFVNAVNQDINRVIEKRFIPALLGPPARPVVCVGVSLTPACDQKMAQTFAMQGDRPTRVQVPASTICLWIYARQCQ
ncbi:hypothetical protein H2198_001026 [Neophaeococcomyces mojaviensis]|uniref:Uncharacterized protein n=1 Tax=Neophaeococcomyces mojaviensis TaxID=3383035 RepID=A0ACC3AIN8_9EURO|nr:hypothetical protein H2198_001026 [Knufia sp. JES_112]